MKHRRARPGRPWTSWLHAAVIAVAASGSAVVLGSSAHGPVVPAVDPARTGGVAPVVVDTAPRSAVVARAATASLSPATRRSTQLELEAARRSAVERPSRGDGRRPERPEVPRWLRGCDTGPAHSAKQHPNGQVPLSDLCRLPRGDHLLHGDAALAWWRLDRAFHRRFGKGMCMTDSYRSYAAQEQVYALKPGLAAVPGTSSHGWGVALDLCGGVEDYDSAAHGWLSRHGHRYGWINPPWARRSGTLPEPWHWEYVRASGRHSGARSAEAAS